MKTISVALDFTRFPAGRLKRNGSTSGQEFRERFLEPSLRANERILVDLDGTIGYGSSFLEEAFGGICRSLRMTADDVLKLLDLRTSDDSLRDEIITYIRQAGSRLNS